jgi:PAS domain S-box-containing protein
MVQPQGEARGASAAERRAQPLLSSVRRRLLRALSSCATEADLVQVLYAELHPVLGYDTINLQVLEREGWYHSLVTDRGVLQDVRRRLLVDSSFADFYREPMVRVLELPPATTYEQGRGPGLARRPRRLIWVPVMHGGRPIGSVSYQLHARREILPEEMALLERVHANLGVLVSNAYLNELTRNQALSLGALNAIARALSATHDEEGVMTALLAALSSFIPVDTLELAIRDEGTPTRLRLLEGGAGASMRPTWAAVRSRRLTRTRQVLESGQGAIEADGDPACPHRSTATVPIVEGGRVRGTLATRSRQAGAYEQSTLTFLQQVADQVALALRNARSYAAIEAQHRRLEVVNAVGSRLASSLDRWSILRTLREELARHLQFDVFVLAAVNETPAGPVATGYVWDSGDEGLMAPVPLASAGPSREAYETGQPILIRRAPWASTLERRHRARGDRIVGRGVLVDVTRPGSHRRVAARSIIWVPVRLGEETTGLLSLQSYTADVFNDWHAQVLQDVATHVGLALANAEHFFAAQTERQRLEALHLLERGVAGASDERQIAEAVFRAMRAFLDAQILMLGYFDSRGRVTGYAECDRGPVTRLEPVDVGITRYLSRVLADGITIAEPVPPHLRRPLPGEGWPTWGQGVPNQILLVPVFNDTRVVGVLSAQREADLPFAPEEIRLLESAAPVVGIALRTARLHRLNEVAREHSVRLQMVAGLAGHQLDGVLATVAEQARAMLDATGAACWAFDDEGRVAAQATAGVAQMGRVLRWSGRTATRGWREAPREPMTGVHRDVGWTVVPLWYDDRLVGALGSVHAAAGDGLAAVEDFAQHAAIAIENARLAAEARAQITTLEAIAGFAHLDISRPGRARLEMCRLVEGALAGSRGAIWLLERSSMVRLTDRGSAPRADVARPDWWGPALTGSAETATRRLRTAASPVPDVAGMPATGERGIFVRKIVVEQDVVGLLTADATGMSPAETRRLIGVLGGQVQLVLGRLRLVAALNRQKDMLETVLSHSPVGAVLEDGAGNVAYANPEVERIYGVSAVALVGTPARRLLERPDAVVVSDPEVDPGGPLEIRLDAASTVVQVRQVPIPGSPGQPARVLTLHEDVTQARAAMEAKDLMLRAIGHEVRSPAAAMRSTIAGLLQWGTVLDADQRHALIVEAYEQSARLLSLVENQLLIAKLEGHQFEPNRDRMALGRSLEQVLTVLRNRHGQRVDVVDVRLSPDLPDAYCEPTHLDQVLTNLIGNALEYTLGRRIRVSAQASPGWLEVTVSDDGSGLPPERVESLFTKTAPAGQNRARGGLGLGLYLCRLVVERSFGGRIWLESAEPRGATFKFTVPAVAARSRRALPAAR